MTTRWIAALLALPVVFMAAILIMTSSNRSTARAPIVLTEREAPAPPQNDDNSAIRLRLAWHPALVEPADWFNRDKLREVGFDVSVDPASTGAERRYRRVLPRDAYVALELAGPAWEAFVAARQATEPTGPGMPPVDVDEYGSRLVPVDAAADAETLAMRYPDGRRHLITAATVGLSWRRVRGGTPDVFGHVRNVDPDRVYVPRSLAQQLPLRSRGAGRQAPYTVTLGYGTRWEPFVIDVSRGDASR